MRRAALAVIVPISIATLVALIWMWPSDVAAPSEESSAPEVQGEVLEVTRESCPAGTPEDTGGCGTTRVRLDDGTEVETLLPSGSGAPEVEPGDDVVLIQLDGSDGSDGGGTTYSIVDQQRGRGLWVLAAAFALAVIAFGRWRGLAALAGLGVTFAVLVLFVVPAILEGSPPLLVAIVGSAAIMLTVLYLTHGVGLSTTVAVLGTLAALTLTGVLSALAVTSLHLTGVTDDISFSVGTAYSVNTQGLLLAGIVIGSLGVLDDVTVTQGAAVAEIAEANPGYGFGALYRAGSRVGRAHIASVINTIVLAYAGSGLPLLILIVAANDPLGSVVTDQVIAQEIVRTAVATLGLIAAVPITTALAAGVAVRSRR